MNPSTAGLWNNPPPPGLEDQQDLSNYDRSYNKTPPISTEHDKKHKERSHRRRSRSKSRDRSRRSKRRHRRSRSRHRHRSRSDVSRSLSRDRSKHRHKERRRRRSHSKSRRSRSRSHRRHHHSSKKSYSRSPSIKKESDRIEEEEETEENKNTFKNDGSFLELYKKLQEEQQKAEKVKLEEAVTNEVKKPMFGKRRGGRVLKTGIVAKNKPEEEAESVEPQDPWSIYLKEVKRYKEACCDDDSKTRPLVK